MSKKDQNSEEFNEMEKQLLKDISILIHKASTVILDSGILKTFHEGLNKKKPTNVQIKNLKKELFECVVGQLPKFDDALELIVERDAEDDKVLVIEFKPKKIKLKHDPDMVN